LDFIEVPDLSEKLDYVAKSLIKSPTKRSRLDMMCVRSLILSGLLDVSCLKQYGYFIDDPKMK
jgi:hypothetical protein